MITAMMSKAEHRVVAFFSLTTVLLFAAGIAFGWSGGMIGTILILLILLMAGIGASIAPRETPRR